MKCPVCDADVDTDMSFCPECGTRVRPASSAGAQTTLIREPAPEPANDTLQSPYQPEGVTPAQSYTPPAYTPPSYAPPVTPPTYTPPVVPPSTQIAPSSAPSMPYTPPMTGYTNVYATVPNSTAAIVSLVMGILAWVLIPFIGAIAAVVAGHMARREIRREDGRVGGGGMAVAGLILGYSQLAILVVGFCAMIGLLMLGVALD